MVTASASLELTLPDGSVRTVEAGTTPLEVARGIGPRLAKDAVGALVDGELVDLRQPLARGGRLEIVTPKHQRAGEFVRHSAEHLLADAVKRLFPGVEIDAGRKDHSEKFQYDFRIGRPFTPEDLARIEEQMRAIVGEDSAFERIEVSRAEAERIFREMGESLKVERLREIPEGETITLYRHGRFTDLCRGPHVQRASQIGAIKLLEASGVYWHGDESKEMLQRVYGTAFATPAELEAYLHAAEQARARDHRRLGPELDLFSFNPLAPAMPFFHPKGAFVYNRLLGFVRELQGARGYGEVVTPQILDVDLWHTSGHYENYREAMFFTEADERQMAVKPMNCPGHCLIFATRLRSYRDLPIRYGDFGRLHRYEKSGVTSGLTRVRSFSQDDAHIFCTEEQIGAEIEAAARMILEIYHTMGFSAIKIELSTRPPKSIGTAEQWRHAESTLEAALQSVFGKDYAINPGDGAFYGPKIDFQISDTIGRWWQLGTLQLDYQMPQRFALKYIGADGAEHPPVMIHRAMLGSLERFLGILIEHTGGAFPVWLAPVQAVVLPVSEKAHHYAATVAEELTRAGVRVELDARSEKLGYKIREAQVHKVPYMLVVGEQEAESSSVALRLRNGERLDAQPVAAVVERIVGREKSRSLEL
ncbi:MAG TPA: threonine--tRNA ligase [Thermoanaerobaculia bacterium]|jgi:threonyl-tRNA synthetase|nr:threonine--tRNA ligase [Thermoanaerobaculia bacterium]